MQNQILNKYQIEFLKAYSQQEWSKDFYLAGGTALAYYYLGHRLSDDLDFFTNQKFSSQTIDLFLQSSKEELWIKEISKQKLYERNIYMLQYQDGFELKIEFTPYFIPHYPLERDKENAIFVENKQDILLDKFAAMMDRNEIKDYVDIFFLYPLLKPENSSHQIFLESLLPLFEKKFGYNLTLSSLGYRFFRGTELIYDALQGHMKQELNTHEMKKFYEAISRELKGIYLE